MSSALTVRAISAAAHLRFVTERSASFLQAPSWAGVKAEWRAESLGWFDAAGELVGAGLVLYRQVPRFQRYLAYLPEGPVVDWTDGDLRRWLDPLVGHLRRRKAFSIKIGPQVVVRRWTAETIKRAIADGSAHRMRDVPPDDVSDEALETAGQLQVLGWRQDQDPGTGFGDVQPRYVFQLPLAGRSLDDVQRGMNQLWRRNIKRADKAGVKVVLGDERDLPEFHALYEVTARRDGFTPRGLSYFQRMWGAMAAEEPDRVRLFLAKYEDEALAATTMVRIGGHAWYSYGASADHGREVRPSNAVQWAMIRDAHERGCDVYDLRGISDTLDPDDRLFGLIQFKLGTGGHAVEYLGEWDYPVNRLMHKAFQLYLARR